MRMIIGRNTIEILPETEEDKAYLEEVFNLRKAGDKADAIRIPPIGLEYSWAYLEIRKRKP